MATKTTELPLLVFVTWHLIWHIPLISTKNILQLPTRVLCEPETGQCETMGLKTAIQEQI